MSQRPGGSVGSVTSLQIIRVISLTSSWERDHGVTDATEQQSFQIKKSWDVISAELDTVLHDCFTDRHCRAYRSGQVQPDQLSVPHHGGSWGTYRNRRSRYLHLGPTRSQEPINHYPTGEPLFVYCKNSAIANICESQYINFITFNTGLRCCKDNHVIQNYIYKNSSLNTTPSEGLVVTTEVYFASETTLYYDKKC